MLGDIVNFYWVNILCLERWTVGSPILSIFVCWYYQYLCADNVINDIISKQIKGLFPDIVSVCWVIVSIFIGWIFCVWKGGLLDRQYCQYLESASSYRYWATITKVTPPLKIIELIFNENWRKEFTREFPTTFISILQFKCLKWESLDLKDNEHWLFRLLQDKFQGRTEWICTIIQPFTGSFNFFFFSPYSQLWKLPIICIHLWGQGGLEGLSWHQRAAFIFYCHIK